MAYFDNSAKFQKDNRRATRRYGNFGSGTFRPKRPVRSFRDLEVYQEAMNCSVLVAKDLRPKLARLKYELLENMINCSLSIPLWIGESHSLRFSDFPLAVLTLEKAMAGCNKMIIYLEQCLGIFGPKLPTDLIDDLMRRYMETRGKMFRLEKSWQKFKQFNALTPNSPGTKPSRF